TTQGRNALAGTVVIKSRDPSFEPEVRVRATAGELDRREAALALSGPVIENQLALRLSGEYRERTTDINFTDPGNAPLAEDEFYNIRGKALYQPNNLPGFEVLLTINHVFDAPSSAPVSGPDFFERNFAADSIFTEFREMTVNNYSLDLGYEITDGFTLRSVSAFTDTDLDISSAPSSPVFFRQDNREDSDFTQEFRLELDRPIAGVTGVAGLFYGSFEQETDSFISFGGITAQDGVVENETETLAAYADLRYALSERTSVIVGGRLQNDTVSVSVGDDFSLGAGVDESTEDTEFLPRLGLSFAPSNGQTVTASINRGYRQGFTERRVTLAGTTIAEVDPEFLWAYEVAYRHEFLSDRLLLGLNVFYNDYEDQQITVSDNAIGLFPATLNAGESESYGLELEAQYDSGRGLSAYAALGLLETEIGSFTDTNCADGSCEGNAYSEAPEITASIGGSYFHSSGLYGSLAISYTDDFFQSINNDNDIRVAGYTLVDCKIGYRYRGARISLYANNLFDEDYLLGLLSENQGAVGDGREVGIELLAEF
ncbi:MAG: TonB-dependent receptor, partial [Pseudomonadota bacterium]